MESGKTRLSTWADLRDHVASQYTFGEAPDGGLAIDVGAAIVPIQVGRIDVLGAPWVEVVGLVSQTMKPPAPAVLERNGQLAIGVLGVIHGELRMRQLLPLEGLSTAHLDETLAAIAEVIIEAQGT